MSLVNFNATLSSRDLYVLAAGATGAAINRANDAEEVKQLLLFGGGLMMAPTALKAGKAVVWDLPKWAYQNYGNYGPAFANKWNATIGQTNLFANSATRQAIAQDGFWNTVNHNAQMQKLGQYRVPNYNVESLVAQERKLSTEAKNIKITPEDNLFTKAQKKYNLNANKKAQIGIQNDCQKSKAYSKVNKLIKEAQGLKGKELAAKMKEIDKALVEAKIDINQLKAEGKIVSKTAIGRAGSWVKTKTGIRTLENKVLQGTVSKNAFVRTAAKGVKAGGGMFLISAALETPTVVKTYKELGAKKGNKQLGKSLVKVGAETVGYIAGAKLGGIAGAKIGATIGTCIGGPIGTAIGGVVGTLIGVGCGLLGSWLAGKGARALVGKDELEIAKERETKMLVKESRNNLSLQAQLAEKAAQNIQEGNVASEADAESIARSYEKLSLKLQQEYALQQTNSSNNPFLNAA